MSLDAAPLVEEIETVARHARIDLVPGSPPGAPEAGERSSGPRLHITDRERDVLSLVAEGHTNREIGDRLLISEKTASVHVSNAMAKLGALSRYEAAAIAERQGLLAPQGRG
jgi:DNA-binding CsgD family transcriptional regulator